MKRKVWGAIFILIGVLYTLQLSDPERFDFGLAFWPVVLTLLGFAICWSSLRKWRPSWFGLTLGLWIGAIGLLDILSNAGVDTGGWDGGRVASLGWPVALIALGLAIVTGGRIFRIGSYRIKGNRYVRMVGDLRYGQGGRWVLDKDLVVEHTVGDVKLDLSTAEIPEGTHYIRVSQTIGETVIRVPDNVNVSVDAEVQIGEVDVFGDTRSGMALSLQRSVVVPGSGVDLRIEGHLRIGTLRVVQVPAVFTAGADHAMGVVE